ncbi:hypothetical protein GCM10023318_01180 [Nocardia callitridis]|uniref:Uncharacterized protein n=1 Tax=Nocardia callitridis TaxID=648753 RepID=A0ABP9JSK5_9NOCA
MAEITITDRPDEAPSWERCVHHIKPTQPYTVEEAHHVMRQYVDCRVWDCQRKRAAWDVLVEAGRIVPDPSRPQ